MSEKSDRKAELERKKAWLAQIRADKLRKKREEEEKKVHVSSDIEQKRRETEDLLRNIGLSDTSLVVPAEAPKSPAKVSPVTGASADNESGKPSPAQHGAWTYYQEDIPCAEVMETPKMCFG